MEQADRKQVWNSQILLYEMLEARESRYKKQKELIREGKGTLVCLMLNVPGPVKVTALTDWAFEQGKERITCRLKESGIIIKEEETDYKKTGYELYMIVDADAVFVKKQLVSIEEENKLGRLFDIDVISVDGDKISRMDICMPPRKCLLCGKTGHGCSRNRTHSIEDMTAHINQIIKEEKGERNHADSGNTRREIICEDRILHPQCTA